MGADRWLGASWEFVIDGTATTYVVDTQEQAEALEVIYLALLADLRSGAVESAGIRRL